MANGMRAPDNPAQGRGEVQTGERCNRMGKDRNNPFAVDVRRYMAEQGCHNKDLAERLELDPSVVSHWAGGRMPGRRSMDAFYKLSGFRPQIGVQDAAGLSGRPIGSVAVVGYLHVSRTGEQVVTFPDGLKQAYAVDEEFIRPRRRGAEIVSIIVHGDLSPMYEEGDLLIIQREDEWDELRNKATVIVETESKHTLSRWSRATRALAPCVGDGKPIPASEDMALYGVVIGMLRSIE